MNIVTCIKQVPDVDDIKWTEQNNLDRSQMLSKLNKYDEYAIEHAVKIKNMYRDCKLTAVSMGPLKADEILHYALAKGFDRAILLSDKLFSGSDTLATSKILSSAIEKYIKDFDYIITGQMAQDGDTAQVPVSLAALLNIFDISNIVEIIKSDTHGAMVKQEIQNKINIYEITHKSVIAVKDFRFETKKPKIDDYIRAQDTNIEIYNADDIGITKEEAGVIGSPTMVIKAFRPIINKNTKDITNNYLNKIYKIIKKV